MSIIANEILDPPAGQAGPPPESQPVTLTEIERRTKLFADAHEALSDEVRALNDEIERAKREHLADLKRLVARCAERHAALRAAVELAPELFVKPRAHVFHGVKVGWQKLKGSIRIPDPSRTVELIYQHLGKLSDTLVRLSATPDKRAITDLPVREARMIGVEIIDPIDEVVIKPADSEVDKIVNALLKEATETEVAR